MKMNFEIISTHGNARSAKLTIDNKILSTAIFYDDWDVWIS